MKWCVQFPEEDILIKRPCLKLACGKNKPASTLLSHLLYLASISKEYKKTAENINALKADKGEEADQLVTLNVYRTQMQLIGEMDGEMSDRTLRDIAVPLLTRLGYVTVDDSKTVNIYVLHLQAIQDALLTPPYSRKQVKQFIEEIKVEQNERRSNGNISDTSSNGNTSVSNGNTSVSNGSISVSIGNTSVSKNGSKGTLQAASSAVFPIPKIIEDSNRENKRDSITPTKGFSQTSSQQKGNGIEKLRPATPKRSYQTKLPPYQYTLIEQACLEAWNSCQECPEDDQNATTIKQVQSLARRIEQSKDAFTIEMIPLVYKKIDEGYWHNKVTLAVFLQQLSVGLKELKTPSKSVSKPASTSSTSSQPTREELAYSMERDLHWTALLLLDIPEEQVAYRGEVIPERLVYQYRHNGGDGLGLLVEQYSVQYGIPITPELAERIKREDATWRPEEKRHYASTLV